MRLSGRIYPPSVKEAIKRLAIRLDVMTGSALELALETERDVPREVSALNTRLVNEVIIIPSQITDPEAQVRLEAISKDAAVLEAKFKASSVSLGVPRPAGLRVFSDDQAKTIVNNWGRAFDLYSELTSRAGRLKAETMAAPEYTDVVLSLQQLDRDVLQAQTALERLQEFAGGSGAVEMDGTSYSVISGWITEVLKAESQFQRLEGALEFRPARIIPTASIRSPWIAIFGATAGLAGIGVVLFSATGD